MNSRPRLLVHTPSISSPSLKARTPPPSSSGPSSLPSPLPSPLPPSPLPPSPLVPSPLVRFYELLEEDRKGVARPMEEWVRSERLRPFPPELTPEEYLGAIEVGDCVEMSHLSGWWQMEVLANPLNAEAAAGAEGGDAPHDPAAPSNLTKSDQLKELREKEQRLRPEPTADEARAARLHVASVVFAAEHNDANFEVLRPVWVWKRKAGTQTKRTKGEGTKGEGGKGEGGRGLGEVSRGSWGEVSPNPNPNPNPIPNLTLTLTLT